MVVSRKDLVDDLVSGSAGSWKGGRANAAGSAGPRCGDLMLVVQTLRQARNETVESAPIAAPGVLWWRAQIRRRSGAVELMSRPVALVEKLALVVLAAGSFCLAAWQWDQVVEWAYVLANLAHNSVSMVDTLRSPLSRTGGWISALVIAGLLTLAFRRSFQEARGIDCVHRFD